MNYNKASYRLILQSAANQGFEFVDFFTVTPDDDKRRQIILRHDIDYSLTSACEMAEIDAKYKIRATFSLLLSSPLYNPFTPTNIKIINEIKQLGHNVVLHHHVLPEQGAEEIQGDIIKEMQIMMAFFPYIQPVFVWHNPPPGNLLSEIEVPGMINAYSDSFVRNMFYISDSVLRNTPENFLKALKKQRLIHMLLHPIIWMSEQDNMISLMSYVLTEIIRDCDREFLGSKVWKKKFPNGIPQEVLDKLQALLSS